MHRKSMRTLSLILALGLSQLLLFSCAGPRDIPESEKKYIEGTVVEGGKSAFRMKNDNGQVMRFLAGDDVAYQPVEFHAYYGDRVGVTYYTKSSGDEELHQALGVVLLETVADRIDFRYGAIDGVVREKGMWRVLVYLPEKELTLAFKYNVDKVSYSPKGWSPDTGDKVSVYFSEEAQRFFKILKCYRFVRLAKDPIAIQDQMASGTIAEILVRRGAKRAPDRFTFQLENGETLTMYGGGGTQLVPNELEVEAGNSYSIQFYRILMGDQSIHHVATMIRGR